MPIKQKLLLTLSALLIAGFAATSLVSYYASRDSLYKQIITNDLPLTGDNIYSEIQRDLLRPVLLSSMMSSDTFLRNWTLAGETDTGAIVQYLNEVKIKYGAFTSFFISEKSRNYYHADGILKQVKEDEPRDKWFFRVRRMAMPYEINVDIDMAHHDTLTIFINHKVFDFAGNFIGAAGLGLNIVEVKAIIENYHRKYQRTIYFVSPDGEVMLQNSSCRKHGNIKTLPGISTVAEQVLRGKSDKLEYRADGKKIFVHTRLIPELGWRLIVEQDGDSATGSIFRTLLLNLALCVLITAVVIVITWVAINSYQRKLEKMLETDLRLQLINREQAQEIETQRNSLLEQNLKLSQLNSAKDKLFSIIAHDLRTPVGYIAPLLTMLEEARNAGDKAQAADILAKLRELADSTFSLLENLFEWARNQVSEIICRPEPLPVARLLRECLTVHQLAIQAKQLKLSIDCNDTLLAAADPNMFRTVIRNLLSNAIKFTPEHGAINIKAEADGNGMVVISVQDSGVGIEPERLPELFNFTQNKSTYGTNGEKGAGLGLAMCHDLINLNHGQITVTSRPGHGSVFSFSLPATKEQN